jgi:serine/threonine protein kinase
MLRRRRRWLSLHKARRALQPENIFLTGSQLFKLGDFGLAIQSSLELPYTRSGTLDYLSPEVRFSPSSGLATGGNFQNQKQKVQTDNFVLPLCTSLKF